MWHPCQVSTVESLVGDWLPLPDVSELLNVSITKVHGLLDDRSLLALRIGERKIRSVPAGFFVGSQVLDSLKGTISVLVDAGFTDEEAIVWLFTDDESLPGRPVDALREGRKTEIRRRAQSLAW
ncbi:DNA-binding protein [Paenarthrobacter sp. Z7-10]|nr:DNA-binding protein [Paenarthrobacter sp. Z7-10]